MPLSLFCDWCDLILRGAIANLGDEGKILKMEYERATNPQEAAMPIARRDAPQPVVGDTGVPGMKES